MRYFQYSSLKELAQHAEQLGASHVRFEENLQKVRDVLGRPVTVAGFKVGNSMAIHPMEGCDCELDGSPGHLTERRYDRFGRGGAKLVWFEACAVCPEGRSNPRQLWLHEDNLRDVAALLSLCRRGHREECGTTDDLLEVLQLTHSGRYSRPDPILAAHNPGVDRKYNIPSNCPVITDDALARLEDDYVRVAGLALRAGFRAVDIKATHGYLVSELLGAKMRGGRYGGALENRTRFLRNVIGKIRAKHGDQLILAIRLGCYEGVPYFRDPNTGVGVPYEYSIPYSYGFGVNENNPLEIDLTEVKQAIAWFKEWGVQLLNVTLGVPYFNPHVGRPFEKPDEGNYEEPEHPLLGVERHFRVAAELQQAFPDLPMVGTGYSWLQKYSIHAGAWNLEQGLIRFFGVGRGALCYPDFARDALRRGELEEERVCKTLSFCTYLMRQKGNSMGQFPAGCPPFDKEVYGPIIREARSIKRLAEKLESRPVGRRF